MMQSNGRLASQVAAEAGVNADAAMVAVYLKDLSTAGRTLDDAASIMRRDRGDVRNVARDWGIDFCDYHSSTPAPFIWGKEARGLWLLYDSENKVIAEARTQPITDSPGRREWVARLLTDGVPLSGSGSSSEVAIKRLSLQLERQSLAVFGADDVAIYIEDAGCRDLISPKAAENAQNLKAALAA